MRPSFFLRKILQIIVVRVKEQAKVPHEANKSTLVIV